MSTTLSDDPTITELLTVLDDDVLPLLDATSGALYAHRDAMFDPGSDQGEAVAEAADLLAQAWANARRAAQIVRDDVPACTGAATCSATMHEHGCFADRGNCTDPDDHEPAPPKLRVVRNGMLWYVVDHCGVYLAVDRTQAGAMDTAAILARRPAA